MLPPVHPSIAPGLPRVIFTDYAIASYGEAEAAILKELRSLRATCLVKSGSILSAPRDVLAVEYGPHEEGGRRRLRSSHRTPFGRQRTWVEQFVSSTDIEDAGTGLVEQIEQLGMDCIAFSSLTNAQWEAICTLPEVQAVSCGRATFAVENSIARYFVWDMLITVGIAAEGSVLTDYEDAPSTVFPAKGSGRIEFICDRDHATKARSLSPLAARIRSRSAAP